MARKARKAWLYGISTLALYWPPKRVRILRTAKAIEQNLKLSLLRGVLYSPLNAAQIAERLGLTVARVCAKLAQPTIRDMGLLSYAAGFEMQLSFKEFN